MKVPPILKALSGDRLHLRFGADAHHEVEVAECPALWMPRDELASLVSECDAVVKACLGGASLGYGLFGGDLEPWSRSIITIIRRRSDGRAVAFNAMPILPVRRAGQEDRLLHLGLVMVDPSERGEGLSWLLYGFTCFALFIRDGLRPVWISSVTQVPAVVGLVAETFADVYPAQQGTPQSFAHKHLAHQIMTREREAFGVGDDAGFDAERQVITDAYTGGSDNLKKSFATAAKHRIDEYNRYCRDHLDYDRGDDILQIGRLDLSTARRYALRSVPRGALPAIIIQMIFVGLSAVIVPTLQWLDAGRTHGRLRPS